MRAEIKRGSEVLAWTQQATTQDFGGHLLVATPRLALEQEPTLCLVSGWSYTQLFAEARIDVGTLHEFQIVHGGFSLFRTGEPDIIDFACIVVSPEAPSPDLGQVIARTAEMLRCLSQSA